MIILNLVFHYINESLAASLALENCIKNEKTNFNDENFLDWYQLKNNSLSLNEAVNACIK